MGDPLDQRTRRRDGHLLIGLALLLAAAGYWRVLHGEFQFDDAHVIVTNPSVKAGVASAVGSFSISARPVTAATFALNYAFGRLDPFSYHLVNLAIHLGAVILLWRLARLLLRRAAAPHADTLAATAAGIFALHPLNSQAVSYIAQRSEALAALLTVATVLLLLAAARPGSAGIRALFACAGLATFALGLGSKLTAVIAPLLWALVAFALPSDRAEPPWRRFRRALPVLIPLAAGALVAGASTLVHLRGRVDAGFSVPGADAWRYLLTQTRAILLYLRLLVWPAGQSVDHDLPMLQGLDATSALLGLSHLGALATAVWLLWRPPTGWREDARATGRTVGVGVLWWFLCLAPTSSVIPVIDVAVEHRAYLASFGLILAATSVAGLFVARLAEPNRARVGFVLIACAWSPLAAALYTRNAVWESKLALWSDAASKATAKVRTQANLAFAMQDRGDLEGAIAGYRRALSLGDDPIVRRDDLEQYLGAALVQAGRPAEALPILASALQRDPWNLALLNSTAITLLELGRPAEAERLAMAALEVAPAFGPGLNTLGECLLAQDRPSEALYAFQRAASVDPDVALRHLNVARVAARLDQRPVACEALRQFGAAGGSGPEALELERSLRCTR